MINKIETHKANVGNKTGWAFSVYYEDRPYPNFVSALYKTKKEIPKQINKYVDKGDFDLYGSAE